ncbi:MAG: HDIG domain-containing protein [bacterium]|nr:HDIG domain-containing protein [bacterium]
MHILIFLRDKLKNNLLDTAIILSAIALFNVFFPYSAYNIPNIKKQDIAPRDIIAPITFDLLKNQATLKSERQSAYDNVPPVLLYDEKTTRDILSNTDNLFQTIDSLKKSTWKHEIRKEALMKGYPFLSKELVDVLLSDKGIKVIDYSRSAVKSIIDKGMISDKMGIPFGKDKKIVIEKNGKERIVSESDIFDTDEAVHFVKQDITSKYSSNSYLLKYSLELIQSLLKANLSVDLAETSFRREKARSEVPQKIGVVLKGEIIVRANDIVDEDVEDKLVSLRAYMSPKQNGFDRFTRFFVKNMIFIIIFFLYILFSNSMFKKLNIRKRDKIFISSVFISNLLFYGIFYQFAHIEYLLPVILSSVLLSLLYSRTFALAGLLFNISAMILYSGLRMHGLLGLLVSSIYAIFLIRERGTRMHFVSVIVGIGVVNGVFAFFIELYRDSSFSQALVSSLYGFINGVISVLLVTAVIQLLERALGRVTRISLMELSDLNHPLLKELAEKTSGTFNHSMIVASLAEKAAVALNADDLLAKVGAYYHDVGKIEKPDYFIENQNRRYNPHQSLPPEISATIIKEHISNGEKLAKKYRMPSQISSFIKSHHGTSSIEYFLEKSKTQGAETDENKYRYEGPLPRTIEETIVMLADSVEAGVRSLPDPDDNSIRKLVESIFEKKLREGQFNESDISVSQILTVRDVFLTALQGIYHPRVDYGGISKE